MRRSPVRRSSAPHGGFARLSRAASAVAFATLGAALIAGCGGSNQAAREPSGSFPVRVTHASFSKRQQIASPTTLSITVQNAGVKTMPNVALTIDSLTYQAQKPVGLADAERPTWVIDRGPGPVNEPPVESEEVSPPGGGETAFVHTWALGKLAPHQSKVFTWKLTPVRAGAHTVHWYVAAGVYGKAKAVLVSDASAPKGSFTVHVAPEPRETHVDPETGAVAKGPNPTAQGPVGVVP